MVRSPGGRVVVVSVAVPSTPFSTAGLDRKPVVLRPAKVIELPLRRTVPVLPEPKSRDALAEPKAVAVPASKMPALTVVRPV